MKLFRASGTQADRATGRAGLRQTTTSIEELFAPTPPTLADGPGDDVTGGPDEVEPAADGNTLVDPPGVADREATADEFGSEPGEDVYSDLERQRPSRMTRLLVVALLLTLGVLGGVWVDRALAPEPQPRVVYLLGQPSSAASTRPGG